MRTLGVAVATIAAAAALTAGAARAAAPRIVVFSGEPVAHRVVIADWPSILHLVERVMPARVIRRAELAGRPRLKVSMFWGPRWIDYLAAGGRASALRPGQADQSGSFYPAWRGRPALIDLHWADDWPRVVPPKALAILERFGVPTELAPDARGGEADWKTLHRPLRLQPLAAGAACPVTPLHGLDGGRLRGLGSGPVYPVFPPRSFTTERGRPGWLVGKTLWAWPPALERRRVRVLVRGMRLDRPGPLRFELGPQWDTARVTRELRLDTTRTVGSFGNSDWGATVTLLLVRSPGCYGLQLDTASGTTTVVIRAR